MAGDGTQETIERDHNATVSRPFEHAPRPVSETAPAKRRSLISNVGKQKQQQQQQHNVLSKKMKKSAMHLANHVTLLSFTVMPPHEDEPSSKRKRLPSIGRRAKNAPAPHHVDHPMDEASTTPDEPVKRRRRSLSHGSKDSSMMTAESQVARASLRKGKPSHGKSKDDGASRSAVLSARQLRAAAAGMLDANGSVALDEESKLIMRLMQCSLSDKPPPRHASKPRGCALRIQPKIADPFVTPFVLFTRWYREDEDHRRLSSFLLWHDHRPKADDVNARPTNPTIRGTRRRRKSSLDLKAAPSDRDDVDWSTAAQARLRSTDALSTPSDGAGFGCSDFRSPSSHHADSPHAGMGTNAARCVRDVRSDKDRDLRFRNAGHDASHQQLLLPPSPPSPHHLSCSEPARAAGQRMRLLAGDALQLTDDECARDLSPETVWYALMPHRLYAKKGVAMPSRQWCRAFWEAKYEKQLKQASAGPTIEFINDMERQGVTVEISHPEALDTPPAHMQTLGSFSGTVHTLTDPATVPFHQWTQDLLTTWFKRADLAFTIDRNPPIDAIVAMRRSPHGSGMQLCCRWKASRAPRRDASPSVGPVTRAPQPVADLAPPNTWHRRIDLSCCGKNYVDAVNLYLADLKNRARAAVDAFVDRMRSAGHVHLVDGLRSEAIRDLYRALVFNEREDGPMPTQHVIDPFDPRTTVRLMLHQTPQKSGASAVSPVVDQHMTVFEIEHHLLYQQQQQQRHLQQDNPQGYDSIDELTPDERDLLCQTRQGSDIGRLINTEWLGNERKRFLPDVEPLDDATLHSPVGSNGGYDLLSDSAVAGSLDERQQHQQGQQPPNDGKRQSSVDDLVWSGDWNPAPIMPLDQDNNSISFRRSHIMADPLHGSLLAQLHASQARLANKSGAFDANPVPRTANARSHPPQPHLS